MLAYADLHSYKASIIFVYMQLIYFLMSEKVQLEHELNARSFFLLFLHLYIILLAIQSRVVKGLSYEIDFNNVDEN